MRKVAIGIAAAIALATVAPASAQGVWIGVPGFGIGHWDRSNLCLWRSRRWRLSLWSLHMRLRATHMNQGMNTIPDAYVPNAADSYGPWSDLWL